MNKSLESRGVNSLQSSVERLKCILEELTDLILVLLVEVKEVVQWHVVLASDQMKNTKMHPEGEVVEVFMGDMAANHLPDPLAFADLIEEWRQGNVLLGFSVAEDGSNANKSLLFSFLFGSLYKDCIRELNLGGDLLDNLQRLNLSFIGEGFNRMNISKILKIQNVKPRIGICHLFAKISKFEAQVNLTENILVQWLAVHCIK